MARPDLGLPGRLLSHDGRLLAADPQTRRIDPERPPLPDGLAPIGLAELDGRLFIGSAAADGGLSLTHTAPSGMLCDHSFTHPLPASSFSDLIPVEEAGDWPDEPDLDWLDSHGQPL